jgi:hypothetical protein
VSRKTKDAPAAPPTAPARLGPLSRAQLELLRQCRHRATLERAAVEQLTRERADLDRRLAALQGQSRERGQAGLDALVEDLGALPVNHETHRVRDVVEDGATFLVVEAIEKEATKA